jgi:hypothetical protein
MGESALFEAEEVVEAAGIEPDDDEPNPPKNNGSSS